VDGALHIDDYPELLGRIADSVRNRNDGER
jgi:hypothetical protein